MLRLSLRWWVWFCSCVTLSLCLVRCSPLLERSSVSVVERHLDVSRVVEVRGVQKPVKAPRRSENEGVDPRPRDVGGGSSAGVWERVSESPSPESARLPEAPRRRRR